MRFIVALPLLLLVLVAYNVMAFWEPGALWAEAIRVNMMSGASRDLTDGATYFHTPAVQPSWSRKFTRTTKIGAHIFYRKGKRVAAN